MLNIYSDSVTVPHNEFFAIMSVLRRVYFNELTFNNLVGTDKATLTGLETLMLEYMNLYSDVPYDKFTQKNLMEYLIGVEKVPEKYFLSYDRKKGYETRSMDVNTLNRLIRYKVSPYLLELYAEYQSFRSKCDNINSNYGAIMKTNFVDNLDCPVVMMPFYYTMESTGRIYSKSVDIQGFSHRYDDSIVALKDYFLLWGDFEQIDLRVALELCLTGDEVLAKNIHEHSDRYEAFARAMSKKPRTEF